MDERGRRGGGGEEKGKHVLTVSDEAGVNERVGAGG